MSASTQKKKHLKAVRPKLRAKEPLLGVFMWGINYSASIINQSINDVNEYRHECLYTLDFLNVTPRKEFDYEIAPIFS